MKMLFALALMSAALPVSAHSVLLSRSSTLPMGFTAVSDAATDRVTYSQKAHDDMRDWQQKLSDFDVKAKAEGKDADQAAKADLNKAWDKTEIAARKLQTSGEEGWDAAKAEYEKASQDLANAWHRMQAEHS
jgi:hypothetical protein